MLPRVTENLLVRLLALVEGTDHVCYRYRIRAFEPALRRRGWTVDTVALDRSSWRRRKQLQSAADYDAVVLQRRLLSLWQVALLRRSAKRLIYDIDDAVFMRDSYAAKGSYSRQRLARFWATIYGADAIVVGNPFLHQQTASYVDAEKVVLIPTCVEHTGYPPAGHAASTSSDAVRLVWIGQQSTLPSLTLAGESLAAATRRVPNLALAVVCDAFPTLRGVRVESRTWSSETEATELARADIGLSWLPDDPWSRGKCGLKVLQYMAAGLPVVANPVGMNLTMVEHGRTGFIAETPEEWADSIGRLANDPQLRSEMGAAARRRVCEHYSVRAWEARFTQVVEQVARPDYAAGYHQLAGWFEESGTSPGVGRVSTRKSSLGAAIR